MTLYGYENPWGKNTDEGVSELDAAENIRSKR
jgi:hypothetical protein